MNPQDLKDLKQLIEFLKEHQVGEFDLERGDLKIRLKFSGTSVSASELPGISQLIATAPQAAIQAVPPVAAAPALHAVPAAAASAPQSDSGENLHVVRSPIVGTFYGSPSPGAPAFVAVGDRVDKGQVVCIIEAMKLMNEIESDATGEIAKVFVSNGQAVEFGQPLFAIRAT